MEIENVIVTHPDNGIVSVDSFAVVDSQLRNEVVEQAEQLFIEKCVELKFGNQEQIERIVSSGAFNKEDIDNFREDVSECLDDGYFEVCESLVSLVWSYVENVQL